MDWTRLWWQDRLARKNGGSTCRGDGMRTDSWVRLAMWPVCVGFVPEEIGRNSLIKCKSGEGGGTIAFAAAWVDGAGRAIAPGNVRSVGDGRVARTDRDENMRGDFREGPRVSGVAFLAGVKVLRKTSCGCTNDGRRHRSTHSQWYVTATTWSPLPLIAMELRWSFVADGRATCRRSLFAGAGLG